mmetsp:Transcript_9506/g.43206  ORF Transcript_9506/g.43206 Transcript_9506/m.43206 type:complete len:283 (-) Transcript_9506:3890-4738(-)
MASFVERSSAMARSNSSSDRSNAPPAFATASSCALAAVPRRRMPSLTPSSSRMARVNDAWCSPQIRSTASAFSRRTHSSASTAAAPEAPTCAPEMTPAAPRASAKCTSGAAISSGRERSSPSDPFVDAACASRMARISSAMRRSAGDGRFAVPSASSSSSPPAAFASCAFVASCESVAGPAAGPAASTGVGGSPGVGGIAPAPAVSACSGERATYRATTVSLSGSSVSLTHRSMGPATARSMSGVIVSGARSAPSGWCGGADEGVAESSPPSRVPASPSWPS